MVSRKEQTNGADIIDVIQHGTVLGVPINEDQIDASG